MKERKVRNELLSWLCSVLYREKIRFYTNYDVFIDNNEEFVLIKTECNAKTFHRCLERAMCEKESIELHHGRPVHSLNERRSNKHCRGHILKKDLSRIQQL